MSAGPGLESLVDRKPSMNIMLQTCLFVQGVLKGFDQATNIILDESHERVYSTKCFYRKRILIHLLVFCSNEGNDKIEISRQNHSRQVWWRHHEQGRGHRRRSLRPRGLHPHPLSQPQGRQSRLRRRGRQSRPCGPPLLHRTSHIPVVTFIAADESGDPTTLTPTLLLENCCSAWRGEADSTD
ncbi:hypothetical protein V8G54_031068 [Vigna mungo]|uniref:Sm domain-containing protein n=1 Tax=Vigna mungo TaxID=3915 RepID=A0AAQ3MXM5_VIGMU